MMRNHEENLREAACNGDTEAVLTAITENVNVNSRNCVNGWTALHWAARRNNQDIVRILLGSGADREAKNNNGDKPVNLATDKEVIQLLNDPANPAPTEYKPTVGITTFIPNYIKHPLFYPNMQSRIEADVTPKLGPCGDIPSASDLVPLVLKIRVHGSIDPDFIEIELSYTALTFIALLTTCCYELEVEEQHVERLRKLPNTRLRNDRDVQRLRPFQALEVVLRAPVLARYNDNYRNVYNIPN